jgi:O-antigen ligase
MWKSGLAMWREHPILGVGPGGVKREYVRYAREEAVKKRTGHVHNTPLQILVERGVLGLAVWLWLWIAFYAHAIRRLRRLPAEAAAERALVVGGIVAITGFLIGGLSEYNFGDSEVAMVAWCVMALPFIDGAGDTCEGSCILLPSKLSPPTSRDSITAGGGRRWRTTLPTRSSAGRRSGGWPWW